MTDIKEIIFIAKKAGEAILDIYHHPDNASKVNYKEDNSPLTLADEASHVVIMRELKRLFPDIPIISEEGKDIPYEVRKNYSRFWLVDPLDGTKEFIHRNGDFTVNIALIEDGYPTAGVVYLPVTDTTYYGEGKIAIKVTGNNEVNIKVSNKPAKRTAVRSRSHASPEEEVVLERYDVAETVSRGSALKFCVVAEGLADLYYRHGPTMEWDTAAGQAVVEAAGGYLFIGDSATDRFRYNKKELLNPGFLCLGFPPQNK